MLVQVIHKRLKRVSVVIIWIVSVTVSSMPVISVLADGHQGSMLQTFFLLSKELLGNLL